MADSAGMGKRVLLTVGFWMVASTAGAQTWTACIDAATRGLTTEGYRAVLDAAAAKQMPGSFLSYDIRPSVLAEGAQPPIRRVQLELMYAGVSAGFIRSSTDTPYEGLPVGEKACFEITAGPGHPGLWHYWGPYFDPGSAVIPEGVRPTLEYLIPGYQPGRTVYRVEAHADTAGPAEQNERLTAARADAVARELVRLGVRWEDIEQQSFGETRLARPTADGVSEPLNRRAFIDVRTRPEPAR